MVNCQQNKWQQYQVPIANLEPSIGTISPLINLHGWQEAQTS